MLQYSIAFLIISIIAAILGFTALGGPVAWIAQIIFIICLAIAFVAYLQRRKSD